MGRPFRGVLIAGAVLGLSITLSAWSYVAFEQITVAGSSIGFTAAKVTPPGLSQATIANCTVESNEIRYTLDGTTPTASVGVPVAAGASFSVIGHDLLVSFRAIRTGSSGQLNCHYFAP